MSYNFYPSATMKMKKQELFDIIKQLKSNLAELRENGPVWGDETPPFMRRLEDKVMRYERENHQIKEEACEHLNRLQQENNKLRETLKYYWSQGKLGKDHGIRGEEGEDWNEELENV